MPALVVLQFEFPFLLQFDKSIRDGIDHPVLDYLKRLQWVAEVPCDSPMHDILDDVSLQALQHAFAPCVIGHSAQAKAYD